MTGRNSQGPESTVTLGDDDLTLLDDTDDTAVTNRAPMVRTPNISPAPAPSPAPTTNAVIHQAPAGFDGTKTLKIQVRPDPLASTVVLNDYSTIMLDASALEQPAAPTVPFRSGTPVAAPPPPAAAPPARPGEFTGTVTLSTADLLQAEIQPALPFGTSAAKADIATFARTAPEPAPPPLVSPAAMPAPRTIGEAAVAGAFITTTGSTGDVRVSHPDAPLPPIAPEAPRDTVVLLFLHRPSMQRIVRKPAWQRILDALEDEPIDPEADDPALSTDPSEIQEQAQAYAILKQGRCIDRDMALSALESAANKAGRFAPPLELFEGELEPALDDVETLRALVSLAPSFAVRDERLQTAIAAATGFLDTPGAMYAPPLVRRHYSDVRQAYIAGKHPTQIDEIDALVVRALLEKRNYRKQRVLGGEHIRATLFCFGQSEPFVVYIPSDAGLFLPLGARFRARILAEVHFSQDQQETSPMALRTLAFGSVVRRQLR